MKNECQATQLLLERYLDRELTEQESAAVESHLNRCPDCQNQLSIYQKTGALLKTSLGRSVDGISLERLWPRIEQAIRNRPQPAVTGRIFSSRYLAPVLVSATAAILLILLIGVLKKPFTRIPSQPPEHVLIAGKIQENLGQDLQAYSLLLFTMTKEIKTFEVQLESLKQDPLKTTSPQLTDRRQEEMGQMIRDYSHHRFEQLRTAAKLQERLGTGIRDSAHLRYRMASS